MQFLPANLYTHFHQPLLFIHKDPASYKNSRSLKGNASHTNTHCMPDNTQHVHKSRTAVARHTVLSSLFSFSNMEFKDLQPLGLTGHAGLSLRLVASLFSEELSRAWRRGTPNVPAAAGGRGKRKTVFQEHLHLQIHQMQNQV